MTRIGRKILWLMVFIGFVAAVIVFFAFATSGFRNWNGNEWFDHWGKGKPVTTTVSNDKDKPVAQSALRLNNSRSDEAITIPRYLLKTTTQKSYVNTSGKVQLNPRFLFSSKPETYDDYNYIVSFEFSKLSQYKVGATQFSITFCCNSYNFLDLSVSFNRENLEERKLRVTFTNPLDYSPTGSGVLYEFEKEIMDSHINGFYFTFTDDRFFISYVADTDEGYEKSKDFILLDFQRMNSDLPIPFSNIRSMIMGEASNFSCNSFSDGTNADPIDNETFSGFITGFVNYYKDMEIPEKEGYTFTGWYYDEACTRPYQGEPITADTNLYAGFVINKYTVTFDLREVCDMDDPNAGDTYFHTIEVEHGQTASYTPAAVTGKTFLGWFTVDGTKYENTPIKQDTELIGRWTNICYTVTFDVNGGDSDIAPMTVEHGTVAELPVPERTGFEFLGWVCTNNSDFETSFPVTSDLDLKAEWKRNVFTVTFYVDNTVFKTIQVEYGQTLGSATTDSGISPALVVGFENVNTTTAAATLNEFEVVDDVAVYLSEAPVVSAEPNDSAIKTQMNKVVRFLKDNWILLTCCAVVGIIFVWLLVTAFKRKKR